MRGSSAHKLARSAKAPASRFVAVCTATLLLAGSLAGCSSDLVEAVSQARGRPAPGLLVPEPERRLVRVVDHEYGVACYMAPDYGLFCLKVDDGNGESQPNVPQEQAPVGQEPARAIRLRFPTAIGAPRATDAARLVAGAVLR